MKCPVCKKNIPDTALKCPHCKTRTGIICSNCNTVNPVGSLSCQKCGKELLKICSSCGSVNFPNAEVCRKCSSPFGKTQESEKKQFGFNPSLVSADKAFETLTEALNSKDKKIFSITGEKGIGKTTLLKRVIQSELNKDFRWCCGKCTPLTQLTPGGVIQDMLLNLFKLPNYCATTDDINENAINFFSNEFKFLDKDEIADFINFLYTSKDGHYEDIILNKKRTYSILNKIFDALRNTGKFVFVVDNFDFVDGFSLEFLTNFLARSKDSKNLKIIVIYEEHKPVTGIFSTETEDLKSYQDIHLAHATPAQISMSMTLSTEAGAYVSDREKEIILEKCNGNPAFVEQAVSYCFDCQIADKAFLMPKTFAELINERLITLKSINKEAHKMLCGAAILGDKINLFLLKDIFGYKNQEFNDIVSYLVKSNFIRKYNEIFYEFNNLLLWETVLKKIQKDDSFEDINVKVGKALSVYTLNTNAAMAMIAHNLKENRLAFDIWTKTTRLASYIGDVNLYVISQKQCLALLNEFNENETLDIRYNISERLGKLLTEYDPQEAPEYLPDAIARAKTSGNVTKEIELLGYLALSCKKIGNYFGDVECADNVLKHLNPNQTLEAAMIKASKIPSLLSIGNCGEVINMADNDILPILTSTLQSPKLDIKIPLGFIYDTRIRVYLNLAQALVMQGNERAFEILTILFDIIEKQKVRDNSLYGRAKLVLAFANTMKGDFNASFEMLSSVSTLWGLDNIDIDSANPDNFEDINNFNLISAVNRILLKDYENLKEDLCQWAMFAQNTGYEFHKNIFKTFLGKILCDSKQAKRALEIYNEQITYFSDKKLAFGALLCWYFIAEATIIASSTKEAIDIAQRALEIAQNPRINNIFFIVQLEMILAKANMKISDFESAKINLDTALAVSKKYGMNDLTSKVYLIYGRYYQDLGSFASQNQTEYLKGSKAMYDRALELVIKSTRSVYMKDMISQYTNSLAEYCDKNGINI